MTHFCHVTNLETLLIHPSLPQVSASRQDLNCRLMVDIAGTSLSTEDIAILRDPRVGSLILFTRNYENPAQLRRLCLDIHECRPDLKIAVDHEGGRVQRFRLGFSEIPPMRSLGALYRKNAPTALSAAYHFAELMASELALCHIDFTFAPVLDLDYQHSSVIGNRAFTSDPATLVQLAKAFCAGLHAAGMPAIGKHFPGHGFVEADSHTELPVDNRSLEVMALADIQPFAEHATIGLDAMMTAHVVYSEVDAKPASYSSSWMHYLRKTLNFNGLIFSDDLSMVGALQAGDITDRCRAALDVGCDILIICNDREAVKRVLASG